MDHILARIKGVKMGDVKSALKADAPQHAAQGLVLRHVWRNANDHDEILFIFTTPDLDRARKFIETAHAQARREPRRRLA
jgi:hypothetical protein